MSHITRHTTVKPFAANDLTSFYGVTSWIEEKTALIFYIS